MHIKEIVLKNWRSYKEARFAFPSPTGKKRVILVGAMNGTGKTSLLAALYLGLFGREGMYYVEGVRWATDEEERYRSYRQLLERILHRGSTEGDDANIKVQLVFDLGEAQPLVITRVWHFSRGGKVRDLNSTDGEEVIIEYRGRPRRFGWQEANNKIEDYLFPPHVLPCFFFDGEQAQRRVEGAGGLALSDAIQTLYGTRLLSNLADTLKAYVDRKKLAVNRDVGRVREDELSQKRSERDRLQSDLKLLKQQRQQRTEAFRAAEQERSNHEQELIQMTGSNAVDIQLIAAEKSAVEQQERRQFDDLQRQVAALAFPIAFKRYSHSIASQLNGEIVRDRWQILREDTTSKIEDIVAQTFPVPDDLEPSLTSGQRHELRQRLRTAMESIWSPPPQDCAAAHRFHFLGSSDRINALQRLNQLSAGGASDTVSLLKEWIESKRLLDDVRRRWDDIRDIEPKMRAVKTRLEEAGHKAKTLLSEVTQLETNERGIQGKLADLAASIAQMEAMKERRGPEEDRIELAERAREALRDIEDELKPLCVRAIEAACTKHFRAMISQEYAKHAVKFDEDDQPMLVMRDREPIYITTMSGAQKRAFGLAFTLAVAGVSGAQAPIVIDTPVGSMDSEYRSRIIKYLAVAAPGQLFFLSHDEELYGDYVRDLEPTCLKKYQIAFRQTGDGVGVSTVIEDSYFGARR